MLGRIDNVPDTVSRRYRRGSGRTRFVDISEASLKL